MKKAEKVKAEAKTKKLSNYISIYFVFMPSHEEHCRDSSKRYGKRFDKLHRWMDEPSTVLLGGHRIYRHDPKTTPTEAKKLFGDFADQACLDHIRMDKIEKQKKKKEGTISNKPKIGWWRTHPYTKTSMEKLVDHYWGDDFLDDIIQKCDDKERSINVEYSRKRDRALIAALFLTGGLPEEVVTLKRKDFNFENKKANKFGAFLVSMEMKKKRGKKFRNTFPVWKNDPLVNILEDFLRNDVKNEDDYLFPSPFKKNKPLSRWGVWRLVSEIGKLVDENWVVNPTLFRKLREYHLIENHGFSVSALETFFKVSFASKITDKKHKDWENLLAISLRFKQEAETVKVPIGKFEQNMRILNLVYDSNFLFRAKKGAIMFKEDNLSLITELFTPCQNKYHYLVKITSLANLFDVPLKPLRRLVAEPENKGAIKLVEDWLKLEGKNTANIIETWEKIISLRNAEPVHTTLTSEKASWVLDAFNFFGVKYPVENYAMLWDNIIEKFITSLEFWQKILQDL